MKKRRDVLVMGFALFAMFLGAGNIIFPPFLGAMSGSKWWLSGLGFLITGSGLPVLGVIAVAKAGGKATDISKRVSPNFALVINCIILTFIGPLFAIPRTAATTVELSIRPFMSDQIDPQTLMIVSSLIFFGICLFFILSSRSVMDRIGNYLTPVLMFFLLILIVLSIFKPLGQPGQPFDEAAESGFFHLGFSTGYQTMDALGSIVFGGTVALSILRKGYDKQETRSMLKGVGIIAGLGIMVVYLGFIWIGASGSSTLQQYSQRSVVTTEAVKLLAGGFGQVLLALIIFLACLTTAIGLLFTAGEYFSDLAKGKLSFKQVVVILTGISYLISILGVEGIINLSTPLLEIIYPLVIILIALNLIGDKIKYDECFRWGVIMAVPMGIVTAMRTISITKPTAEEILTHVPLGPQGFAFFVPAVCGCIAGWLYGYYKEQRTVKQRTARNMS
ncbi:MAG: branched-chain amino acid transport system II carrier protein [Eubacteriales bacterium]|nr:branched-chain amino acid transport system II carrier protein [Eubacteriales bacterium]